MAEIEEETTTNVIVGETSRAHDQTEIEIEEENLPLDDDVVASIVEELTRDVDIDYIEKLRSTETVTMCRVPKEIIQANGGGDFEPKMISIGPYHSKNKAFHPMQNLKLQYLNDLLRRNIKNNNVETYTEAIRDHLLNAKAKYNDFAACGVSNAEFLKMLVLDGCFIVEFLLKYGEGPIFVLPGIDIDLLNHDMILIENQVPFSVLEVIYELTVYDHEKLKLEKRCSLFDLAVYYVDNRKKKIGAYSEVKEDGEVDHLLHLLYIVRLRHFRRRIFGPTFWNAIAVPTIAALIAPILFLVITCYNCFRYILVLILHGFIVCVDMIVSNGHPCSLFRSGRRRLDNKSPSMMSTIPTAKEEIYSGMEFYSDDYIRPYNMFFQYGRNSIKEGSKEINDNFFTEFENMLFYEQIYGLKTTEKKVVYFGKWKDTLLEKFYTSLYKNIYKFRERRRISTFAVYMSHLVKTDVDVEVLMFSGMLRIVTTTHGAMEIAEFFSKRRSWLVLPEKEVDFLSEQFKAINRLCNKPHNRRRAKLMKEYFSKPIVVISFFGFLILLSLTAVQTVFSILK